MSYFKGLVAELIPAILAAVVAGMGAYVAVKSDVTTLTVNQGIILKELHEGKAESKEGRMEQQRQAVRLAILEERQR
jgi:hypothetical protein